MKYNLRIFLLLLGVFIGSFGTAINTVLAQDITVNSRHQILSDTTKSAAKNYKDSELRAFLTSKYDYWDARVLASFWGETVEDAKARMGRKILWGGENIALLEQFLVDARVQALQSVKPPRPGDSSPYKFYQDSTYNYNDAEALARFWGEKSAIDAKARIERNLILGNDEVIDQALRYARPRKR
ncbi:hypothetical protein [Nostoc sp. CMAA1605]|uniref:hypothetical protein n=1 Tax=Nostoc sp. CMAA1605 TaxID=2055159 RepID=UPI001F490008|nr:hypothetical protein [Nostoc sp. CMAA1605]MCF4969507.1 hypothetical protein [Nostoc sp. CMAA1605]